jgi:hypothetical protein
MAIRLNLYHEVQRARKQQQYDPLKLSMIGLGVITLCLAAYYFLEMGRTSTAKDTLITRKAEFAKLTPLAKTAKDREDALTKQIEVATLLTKRIEDRFYWGPVFEQVIACVPPHVQFTKCNAEVGNELPRRCQITLDGIAAGDEPRIAAEELRTTFLERLGQKFKNVTAGFKNLEDGTEPVNFFGKRMRTAIFSITIGFTSGEEPPPPPATSRQAAQKPAGAAAAL